MPPPPALSSTAAPPPDSATVDAPRGRPRTRRATLVAGLIVSVAVLLLICLLSIAVGSKQIPLSTVIDALRHYNDANTDHVIVHSLRVPRTVIGLLVGAALGLSGALMQGVTRNPLADPGILGVNGGAALFVVGGIYWFGLTSLTSYVWFAFAGRGGGVGRRLRTRLARPGRCDPGQAGARRGRDDGDVRFADHRAADRGRRHLRPVPVLVGRLAGRPRLGHRRSGRAVHPDRHRARAGLRPGAERPVARRRRGPLSRSARRTGPAVHRGRRSYCSVARRRRPRDRSVSSASPSRTSPG